MCKDGLRFNVTIKSDCANWCPRKLSFFCYCRPKTQVEPIEERVNTIGNNTLGDNTLKRCPSMYDVRLHQPNVMY